MSPSTLKTLSFFNQEMLFSVISFIIIFPSTLLECLVCLGFFFNILVSVFFGFCFFAPDFNIFVVLFCLRAISPIFIQDMNLVLSSDHSLLQLAYNSAIALCCFRKSMFSLIFLQSSSFFSTEVLVCLIISFYLSKKPPVLVVY